MVASYTCFLWFIKGTAARYLRVRAEIELAHRDPPGAGAAGGRDGRRVRVLGLLDAERRGRRRPGGRGEPATARGSATSPTCPATACRPASSWGCSRARCACGCCSRRPLSSLLDDLNTVLLPLKSGSMFVTAACVRGGGRRRARVRRRRAPPDPARPRGHAARSRRSRRRRSRSACSRTTGSHPRRSPASAATCWRSSPTA